MIGVPGRRGSREWRPIPGGDDDADDRGAWWAPADGIE
jgi:hypothetical protein